LDGEALLDKLIKLGLPKPQAEKSVAAISCDYIPSPPGKKACHCFAMLKIKEGISAHDKKALEAGLREYANAARKCDGSPCAQYGIHDGEIYFLEIYDTPAAMDIHIGRCFPAYAKIVPHADMTELICNCDPSELDFWRESAAAWGASKFIVTAAVGGEGDEQAAAEHVEKLVGMGLPKPQAEKSAKAMYNPFNVLAVGKKPCCVYGMLKIKPNANMRALEAGLREYGETARIGNGQLAAQYGIAEGEVQILEVYDSPQAMDLHIGNCFPAYTTILPHADMTELICTCDPSEIGFWKTSASAWGASKFVVTQGM